MTYGGSVECLGTMERWTSAIEGNSFHGGPWLCTGDLLECGQACLERDRLQTQCCRLMSRTGVLRIVLFHVRSLELPWLKGGTIDDYLELRPVWKRSACMGLPRLRRREG
jgi:hypothetical protein